MSLSIVSPAFFAPAFAPAFAPTNIPAGHGPVRGQAAPARSRLGLVQRLALQASEAAARLGAAWRTRAAVPTFASAASELALCVAQPGSPEFDEWMSLTDAYAEQFLLMLRGDSVARAKAAKLASSLQRFGQRACAGQDD